MPTNRADEVYLRRLEANLTAGEINSANETIAYDPALAS